MDWVQGWWTTAVSLGPPWTNGGTDRTTSAHGDTLVGVGPPTTPEHGSSSTGAENGGWSMGIPLWASPELERWCSGRAMATKRWRRRNSAVVVLKLQERGVGAVKTGGGLLIL
jgi:hypothetical protein